MSAEIERLRGRIEALELICVVAITKLSDQDEGMRRDVSGALRSISKSGLDVLSPTALGGFREVCGRAIRNLDPQGPE